MTPLTSLQWPVLVFLANSPWKKARLVAKASVLLYYVWLIVYALNHGLLYDYQKIAAKEGNELANAFIFWSFLFIILHCLIWLPTILHKKPVS